MPLVAHFPLPTFAHLRAQGEIVIDQKHALHQDIRALRIGLLNLMPDAALEATERQFFRLIGRSNQITQFFLYPFTLPHIPRAPKAKKYIAKYYKDFSEIQTCGLDALIVSGLKPTQPDLANEPCCNALQEVVEWAEKQVTSTIFSCLATHAVLQCRYKKRRNRLATKCWGIFCHQVTDRSHPLVRNVNTRFEVPHSRFNEITHEQFTAANLRVLVASPEAGVHIAVSTDGLRQMFFQGHPEYDTESLLKEYKREILCWANGNSSHYPPFPKNYFGVRQRAILDEFRYRINSTDSKDVCTSYFPEDQLRTALDNTWHDTTQVIMNNWIGLVYQVTKF